MSYIHVDVREFGGPECLDVVEDAQLPEPGPGQVRVKVLTAGTGFTDTIIRQGQYVQVKDKPPFTLGYDWFGLVDKLGEGVSGLRVGQAVADLSVIGGYTQYLCVDAEQLVPAPDGLEPVAAVAMLLSYTTAYQMLTRYREIPAGSHCLVHAAGGAVGSALMELGRLMGLNMIGTASSGKHALLRRFGGIPIDYRHQDFVEEVGRLTGGKGVDVVFDTIGGKNWSRSYRCLKRGGLLVGFGALQLTTGEERVPSLLWGFFKLLLGWKLIPDGKSSCFYNIQSRREAKPDEFKADVAALFALLAEGKLSPAIDCVMPLRDAAEAHRRIDAAQVTGKIVLDCQSA